VPASSLSAHYVNHFQKPEDLSRRRSVPVANLKPCQSALAEAQQPEDDAVYADIDGRGDRCIWQGMLARDSEGDTS